MNGDRTHLLIPIHVDALVVGKSNSATSPLNPFTVSAAPNYSLLKNRYQSQIGADLRKPKEAAKPPLKPGIHLHFRLPAAAAHINLNSEQTFPRIPNRWLVQRYYKEKQEDKVRAKAWLVYSDREAKEEKDKESAVVLMVSASAGGPFSFRPTGVASVIWDGNKAADIYDYSSDNKGAEVELTAVTGGDAGFSAHYPACRSILGFYDDLDDVPLDAKISYLVTGWYSGKEDDPWSTLVSGLTGRNWTQLSDESKAKINTWMKERGCVKDFGNKDFKDKVLPSGILCHGTVKGVGRQEDGSALTAQPDPFLEFNIPKAYWVDLGNTSAEAVAARVEEQRNRGGQYKNSVDVNLLQDLVTALQTGLFSQGSNASELDAELHRQSFAAIAGGKTWVIQRAAAAQQENVPASPPVALPPLRDDLQRQLDVLNERERGFDRRERRLRDYRWELYGLWHRLTAANQSGDEELETKLKPNLDVLGAFVEASQTARAVKARSQDRDDAKNSLETKLAELSTANIKYSLTEQPAAPFYVPKDPVVLVTGPSAKAKGSRSRKESVEARVTGDELKSFSYDLDQQRNLTFEATDAWMNALGVSPEYLAAIPPWSGRLLKEVLLLDKMEITGTTKLGKEGGVQPDDFGLFRWKHNPWIPLYLYWEVEWYPDQAEDASGALTRDEITKRWTLEHGDGPRASLFRRNTELVPLPRLPSKQTEKVECSGLSFVGRPLFDLQYARADAGRKDEAALWQLMEQIGHSLGGEARRSAMISQALGGLHDALTMRRAGDQLPPLRYSQSNGKDLVDRDPIGKVLGRDFQPDSSPLAPNIEGDTSPFCPLRTGLLQLRSLRIIDAFGQWIRIEPEKVPSLCPSGRLTLEPASAGKPPTVRLHPRYCQPMRLEFAGVLEEAPAVGRGPVCGWVVPNRFDQNLVLYTAKGRPAGVLQKRFGAKDERTLFYWVAVPGTSGDEAKVSGIQDRYLRDFANFVLSLTVAAGDSFDRLINQVAAATEQRVPEDNPLVSVLIGRPLALVRAELRLEMDGLPPLDQARSWVEDPKSGEPLLDQFLSDTIERKTPPKPNRFMSTGGAENVRWPVRVGDRRSTNDGLVGFFKGDPVRLGDLSTHAGLTEFFNRGDRSRPFYASWGFDLTPDFAEVLQPVQDLELDCYNTLQLTLLMDPQARVHVTSGVLPKVYLELTASQLQGAKQLREVFFQTAPVLGTPTTPHVPKPSDDFGQWSWAYRPNVTGWAEDPNMVSAAELAGPAAGSPTLTEGWLKLKIEPVLIRSLWMKNPVKKPPKGTTVMLAWSLHGADSLQVFRLDEGKEILEGEWPKRSFPPDWTTGKMEKNTTFRVRASNDAGYDDYKDIHIEIEE